MTAEAGTRAKPWFHPDGGALAPEVKRLRCRYAVFAEPLSDNWSASPARNEDICPGLTLFHDADNSQFYWKQGDGPSLVMTTYRFTGTYLSIAASLSEEMIDALGPGRHVAVRISATASRPMTVFVRLNIDVPGGREVLHEALVLDAGERWTLFDLDGARGALDLATAAWLDVIFSDPSMSEVSIDALDVDLIDV